MLIRVRIRAMARVSDLTVQAPSLLWRQRARRWLELEPGEELPRDWPVSGTTANGAAPVMSAPAPTTGAAWAGAARLFIRPPGACAPRSAGC